MKNDNKNKNRLQRLAVRSLEIYLTRGTVQKNLNQSGQLNIGRISVDLPDELEQRSDLAGKKATYPAHRRSSKNMACQKRVSPRNSVNDHLSGSLNYECIKEG
jgi:hypothetical protein